MCNPFPRSLNGIQNPFRGFFLKETDCGIRFPFGFFIFLEKGFGIRFPLVFFF